MFARRWPVGPRQQAVVAGSRTGRACSWALRERSRLLPGPEYPLRLPARLRGKDMATLTKADLSAAVGEEVGLRKRDAAELMDTLIETICARLEAGDPVMISSFGTFIVRDKVARMGRNPKTGEAARIPARRVVTFRASQVLRKRIAAGVTGALSDAHAGM